MVKIYCDICQKEPKDMDFVCEMTLAEVRDVYDVTSKNLNPHKQMMKQQLQVCKECFTEKIKPLLKI